MKHGDRFRLNFGITSLIVTAGLIDFAVPSSLGQTTAAVYAAAPSATANAPYVPTMTFDVASVRENKKIDMSSGFSMSANFVPNTATYRANNWSIDGLISYAYDVDNDRIAGLPNWQFPTLFVIEAKAGREANAKIATLTGEQQWAEKQHMLQALLEDRFKLKTHWETKQGDIYNLVVARGGPKLVATAEKPFSEEDQKNSPAKYGCQTRSGSDNVHGVYLNLHGCAMDALVSNLEGQFGRPVIDKTGLTGTYDIDLTRPTAAWRVTTTIRTRCRRSIMRWWRTWG
jgi:uncharacterized protein (TIGR03435 family)